MLISPLILLNSQFDNTLSLSPHIQSHRTLQTPPHSQWYILQIIPRLTDSIPQAVLSLPETLPQYAQSQRQVAKRTRLTPDCELLF